MTDKIDPDLKKAFSDLNYAIICAGVNGPAANLTSAINDLIDIKIAIAIEQMADHIEAKIGIRP